MTVFAEEKMENEGSPTGMVLQSGSVRIWVAILPWMVITSIATPLTMLIVLAGSRPTIRESVFVGFAIFLAMVVLIVRAWAQFWQMTTCLFRPGETPVAGEWGERIPLEFGKPAAAVVKCLAADWILIVISIASVVVLTLVSESYYWR